MKTSLAVITSLLCLAAPQALWAGEHDCSMDSFQADQDLTIGVVRARAGRLHFLKGTGVCPSADKKCRGPRTLANGAVVVLAARVGDYSCAIHIGGDDRAALGWLPVSGLVRKPASYAIDWTGEWSFGDQHDISIKRDAATGELQIEGEATFGGDDPERVKNGAVRVGSLSARIKADASTDPAFLAFTMTDAETLPFDQGAETDCRVRLRLVGPYLRADDNEACGGMGVTFSGFYHRD
jgi:hypothetical protein